MTGTFSRPHSRPNLLGEEEVVTLHQRDTVFEVCHLSQSGYGTCPEWHRFADWTGRAPFGLRLDQAGDRRAAFAP